MKIVVAGCGNVGGTLTALLAGEGHDVVVIDRNEDVLSRCVESNDIMAISGNAVSPEVQLEAGIDTTDLLIAATAADEVNLLCCFLAKKLGCRHTIARVRNPEYSQHIQVMREDLGLSMSVNLEEITAREISGILQFPTFLRRDTLSKGQVELVTLHIRSDSQLCGMRLDQISRLAKIKLLICAVERNEQVIVPDGSFTLEEGDLILVTATRPDLVKLIKNLDIGDAHRAKSIILLGGGRIAQYLAKKLSSSGCSVKIIEEDRQRCIELSEALTNCLVICGDPTSSELLAEEGISQADAAVAITDSDETNILLTLYADKLGVPKTVTKLDKMEFCNMLGSFGSAVSPSIVSINEIIAYVRDMENTGEGEVMSIHRLLDGRIEALEFLVKDTAPSLGVPLEKVSLKKGILLACITRRGKSLVPSGKDSIMKGDIVVVIAASSRHIHSLGDIFAED